MLKIDFLEKIAVTIDCHPMTLDCTSVNFEKISITIDCMPLFMEIFPMTIDCHCGAIDCLVVYLKKKGYDYRISR